MTIRMYEELVQQLERDGDEGLGQTLRQWALVPERIEDFQRAAEISARNVNFRRSSTPPDSQFLGEALRDYGRQLVRAGPPADAEPILREALAIYERRSPNDWMVLDCRCWLACSIADQNGRAEAEQLLLNSFRQLTERLEQTPIWGRDQRLQIAKRLTALYRSQDNSRESATWQKQVDDLISEAQSTS